MKFNEFGKTGMQVSEIGFGGSRIGGVFAGKHGNAEALTVLGKALDSGITFYDTADMYAQGESETLIGKAFRGRRDQVIMATKGGYCLPTRRNFLKRIKPFVRPVIQALGLKRSKLPLGMSGALTQNFSPAYLTRAVEESLRRLQTDYIDLYQLHSPRAPFVQSDAFGETLQALENLKLQGKVRFYGIATEEPSDAPFCLSAPGISSLQLSFGLLDLEALNQGMLADATARGLGVIARGCFGGGLLKDGVNEAQLRTATPKWPSILALRSTAEFAQRPVLDLALQFCRNTAGVSVTLLGMRTEDHLRDNLRYFDAPQLSAKQYHALTHPQTVVRPGAG